MKSATRKRERKARNQSTETLAMTPMIDVVFQMLIYFVLTFEIPDHLSTMPVWRAGPGPGGGDLPPQIGVNAGTYTWEHQEISLSQLEKVLNRLADLDPARKMIVVPSGASAHQDLVTVLDLMNKSGLENISLISAE
ncbi:biopolymer transporter ExbD [Kiritimatiellaeota bacterium B1221]|nr:biopolymer transporter ExbD [Kiritimatiellaeota bacterium B1221]